MGSEYSFSFCVRCALCVQLLADYQIDPLSSGESYTGPSGTDDGNLCKCSNIAYNLLSACDACQGETWISCVSVPNSLLH